MIEFEKFVEDGKIFYLVGNYKFNIGTVYKFSTFDENLYAIKKEGQYVKIENKLLINKLDTFFNSDYTDVI